jgi:ribosome production factor 2
MAPTPAQAKTLQSRKLQGKQPNARVQRYLKTTQSKLREGAKNALLLKGIQCSQAMSTLLQELRSMQAPNVKLLSKKNKLTPFDSDGQQSLEFLSTKNDCTLLAVASSNKKRPANLVLGRTFDRQILDLAELSVLRYKSMQDYGGVVPKKKIGSKPLMLFVGDMWEQESDFRNLRSLLTDFYRGDVVDKLVLTGLDHMLVFTLAAAPVSGMPDASAILLHQRTYFMQLKKGSAGSTTPVPFLQNCGPDVDFRLGRRQWAEPDLYKAARQLPAQLKRKKSKNRTTNLFGEKIGRLHLSKQNVEAMGGRKVKALRRAEKAAATEEKAALEGDLAQEKQGLDQEFQHTFGFAPESKDS